MILTRGTVDATYKLVLMPDNNSQADGIFSQVLVLPAVPVDPSFVITFIYHCPYS